MKERDSIERWKNVEERLTNGAERRNRNFNLRDVRLVSDVDVRARLHF